MPAANGDVLLRVLFFCVYGQVFAAYLLPGVAKNFRGGGMIIPVSCFTS